MDNLDELPDKRRAIKGYKRDSDCEVLIRTALSKNLYFCPGCNEVVDIGLEHTLVIYITRSGYETHGHWHYGCMHSQVLPKISSIEVVDPGVATKAEVNKRLRRRRYRRSKRGL
jgi:hypothetical protein